MLTVGQVVPWLVLAAVTGGLGAATRFVVDGEIRLRWSGALPVSTLLINLTGSLALGLTVGIVGAVPSPSAVALAAQTAASTAILASALAAVGFCGGFTTFSTAVFEVTQLIHRQRRALGLAYLLGTAVGAVGAVVVGMVVGSLLRFW